MAISEWASDVIKQCREVGTAVFVKQLGPNARAASRPLPLRDRAKGAYPEEWPPELRVQEFPLSLTTRQRKTERAYSALVDLRGDDRPRFVHPAHPCRRRRTAGTDRGHRQAGCLTPWSVVVGHSNGRIRAQFRLLGHRRARGAGLLSVCPAPKRNYSLRALRTPRRAHAAQNRLRFLCRRARVWRPGLDERIWRQSENASGP
jgi:hypothetical protein